jgi:2-furoate---CoA ligase
MGRVRRARRTISRPGEEGQIIAELASDEAFEGYWQRPMPMQRALRDGWYFTGDTGYFDDEGDLYVTGRVDDMIICGGENISPVEIESVLSLHPAVEEVAVAGLRRRALGPARGSLRQAPIGRRPPRRWTPRSRSGLMSFKRPREYVFVRAIPSRRWARSCGASSSPANSTAGRHRRRGPPDRRHSA